MFGILIVYCPKLSSWNYHGLPEMSIFGETSGIMRMRGGVVPQLTFLFALLVAV